MQEWKKHQETLQQKKANNIFDLGHENKEKNKNTLDF